METKETYAIDRFIQSLRDAQVDLEEFAMRLSIGKANAKDKFEEVKSSLKQFSIEVEDYFYQSGVLTSDDKINFKKAFDELRLQLSLGLADAKDVYQEQKKKIETQMSIIESVVSSDERVIEMKEKLLTEFEKARIKMEILQLQFSLGKLEAQSELEKRNKELSHKIEDMEATLRTKKDEYISKVNNFQTELKSAYSHFRKAFLG